MNSKLSAPREPAYITSPGLSLPRFQSHFTSPCFFAATDKREKPRLLEHASVQSATDFLEPAFRYVTRFYAGWDGCENSSFPLNKVALLTLRAQEDLPQMQSEKLNSFVFVGGEFGTSMIDERELFGGELGPEQFKAGPAGHFSYAGGHFWFNIAPNRIDLMEVRGGILSAELLAAGATVAAALEPLRRAVRIDGIGMNCVRVLESHEVGMRGQEFC